MKRYNLKDSEIEWFGKIPTHWKIKKLTVCVGFIVGFTPSTENPDFFEGNNVWVTIDDLNTEIITSSALQLSEKATNSKKDKLVPKGSLLYSFKLSVGKIGFAGRDLYTNEAIASFPPTKKLDSYFLSFALSDYLINYAKENIYGAKLLNSNLIKCAKLLIPPKQEQEKISAYLLKEIKKVNETIKLKESQIKLVNKIFNSKLFEMTTLKSNKLGWNETKLKEICWINNQLLVSSTEKTYRLKYIDISNVNRQGIISTDDIEEMLFEDAPSRAKRIISRGDVILSSVRPNLQAIEYISLSDNNLICSTGFFTITPKYKKIHSKYIYYSLLNHKTKSHLIEHSKGANYPAVEDKDFKKCTIYYPAYKIQEQIIYELDSLKNKTDNLVKKITAQISSLNKYKESIIHECVTGKKCVLEVIQNS
jgi:type I restriction enzyme, S subunit